MTEQAETVEIAWGWGAETTADVLDDPQTRDAYIDGCRRDAVQSALLSGFELVPDTAVYVEITEPEDWQVTMDADPGRWFDDSPHMARWLARTGWTELLRQQATEHERRRRHVRVGFLARGAPETPGLRQLGPRFAEEVMRQGIENLAAADAAGMVCGEPSLRHDFGRWAQMLSSGQVQSAPCRRCGREVYREELLDNAADEQAGVVWWAPDTESSVSRQHFVDTGRYLTRREAREWQA